METTLTTDPAEAAAFLRNGELAAFPTETVYGLGANAFDSEAVEAIFEAKGRPSDNPLIVHVARQEDVGDVVDRVPPLAQALFDRFSPGPLTLILPKDPSVPSVVTADLDTIGVRIPGHELAQKFLTAFEGPVAAPSANRSGRPSPTTWEAVQEDLGGRIACILQGGRTQTGVESTVLDCTVTPPVLLRPGAVSFRALQQVVGPVEVQSEASEERPPRSPGTHHRHYAPSASVHLIDAPSEATSEGDAGYIGLDAPPGTHHFRRVRVVPDVETYAHELFRFFRICDHAGCTVIYAQTVRSDGLGRALNDRLERAAAG